jgi:Zn-dependent protease with chaperone function
MGTDIIPYDPYHPHLGYTLAVSILAWVCVAAYCQLALKRQAWLRTLLYAVAIGLPIFGELTAYVINRLRPAPDTPIGYVLTHIHANVIQRIPIDSFLSPTMFAITIGAIVLLTAISLARFLYGTRQLNRALQGATLLEQSEHAGAVLRLRKIVAAQAGELPPILLCDVAAPMAFTTGIFRPRAYVTPALFELLTPDEMLAVLCHEWAHIQRRDTLWNWLIRLLRDVVWFLPGSHLAWQSMVASQDEACDALAAQMTNQPLALARALVKMAGAKIDMVMPSLVAASPFALAGATPRERVAQMIRLHEEDGQPSRISTIGAFALISLLLVLAVLPALLGS